jgi:acetate kinase
MPGQILVINAGSSSIKFSIFDRGLGSALTARAHGQVEGIGTVPRLEVSDAHGRKLADQRPAADGHDGAIAAIHDWYAAHIGSDAGFAGVGHRIVHGGVAYAEPVLIDDRVLADLAALTPLAPLHQPHNLAAVRAVAAAAPDVPQVACFDTAFHHGQPALAREFAVPRALTAKGVRRYGFHGLSYEYIVSALPAVAPELTGRKLVVAHLGNGASMCAIDKGRSVATTMGFSAVDGLVMGTRTGSLDPGVILYLLDHERMDARAIERLIYNESGLLGVSGISSDMRTLLASDAPAAQEAVDLFVYRIGRELGSLAAALGGLDGIVFTGGIGEHAARIRADVCRNAGWLGVALDDAANERHGPRISQSTSKIHVFVVPTDENLMIARHARDLLDRGGAKESRNSGRPP